MGAPPFTIMGRGETHRQPSVNFYDPQPSQFLQYRAMKHFRGPSPPHLQGIRKHFLLSHFWWCNAARSPRQFSRGQGLAHPFLLTLLSRISIFFLSFTRPQNVHVLNIFAFKIDCCLWHMETKQINVFFAPPIVSMMENFFHMSEKLRPWSVSYLFSSY